MVRLTISLVKKNQLVGLDFGCGLGVHTALMHQFEINGFGIDIVDLAIEKAKHLYLDIESNFSVIKPNSPLAYSNNFFDVVLSVDTLDSMSFELAKGALKEIDRVSNGVTFISLISSVCNISGELNAVDEVVTTLHENGTIQAYYDSNRIAALLESTSFKVIWKTHHLHYDNNDNDISNARYYLVLDNRV